MSRREAVTRALRKLREASPSQILRVAREEDPTLTLQDINFDLYHGSRDPKKQVYEKVSRGRYRLIKN